MPNSPYVAPEAGLVDLRVLPAAVRDVFYDLIARSRYRIFGRYDTCPRAAPRWA